MGRGHGRRKGPSRLRRKVCRGCETAADEDDARGERRVLSAEQEGDRLGQQRHDGELRRDAAEQRARPRRERATDLSSCFAREEARAQIFVLPDALRDKRHDLSRQTQAPRGTSRHERPEPAPDNAHGLSFG